MSYTKGPLTVTFSKWPFYMVTRDKNGDIIFSTLLPHFSTKHKTVKDALSAKYIDEEDKEIYARTNKIALADEILRASAPDLLEDLKLAAETLRLYEDLHRAKGTMESDSKADKNAMLAIRFENTISRATREKPCPTKI